MDRVKVAILFNFCLSYISMFLYSSGDLELSAKCFQDLILKDQNHPAALINYAALLLCKYGSVIAGMHYICLNLSFFNH